MPSFTELTYNALVRMAGSRSVLGQAVWERAWDRAWRRLSGPVHTSIHGHDVVVNAGYAYPAFSRRWPTYNDPLVEVVHQAHVAKGGGGVTVIDVGAAVGDTVLLILERCRGAVEAVHCVEGDDEFFGYLAANLADVPQARLHRALLSDAAGEAPSLVRTHKGTASAQGADRLPAVTLDSVLEAAGSPVVDVLKSDTDGFDGKVLAGATGILERSRPAVIFEWHPLLYDATGQDRHRPFQVLADARYRWLVWFDKYGAFSHVDDGYRPAQVDVLAELCVSGRAPGPDWHYDVVALPAGSPIEPAEMAALTFARSSRSRLR
jgi:FkbM family methyltransferase